MKSKALDLKRIKIAIASMLILVLTASTLLPVQAEEIKIEPEVLTVEKRLSLLWRTTLM